MKIKIALLILSSIVCSVKLSAQDKRFLIDFGTPTMQTTTTGWNNVTNTATGTDVTLVESTGTSSSIHVVIASSSQNGYGGGTNNGYNPDGYNGTVLDYPVSACHDSHFSYSVGGVYKLTGLNTSKFYTIRIFGARAIAASDRVGTFTFNGTQKTLNAANNSSTTIVFYNLKPTAQGELVMDFGVASGSQFGYLSVMDVGEYATPGISAPSGLSTSVSGTTGTLNWTDNSNNETGFVIARRLSTQTLFETVGQVGAGVTTYNDTGLTQGTTYVYRVYSKNSSEESAFSNESSFTVPVGGSSGRRFLIDLGSSNSVTTTNGWNNMTATVAGTSVNLKASDGTSTSINLVSVVSPHNGYGGAANGTNDAGYNGELLDYPASACIDSHFSYLGGGQYKFTGLEPSRFYTIRMFGSRSVAANDRVGTYTINKRQLTLNASNNSTQTIVFFYQKSESNGELTLDFGVAAGSQFGYLNVVDVRETTSPAISGPTTLAVSQSSTSGVLTWTDNANNETGFRIARRLSTETLFTTLASVGANVTTYTDTNLTPGATYIYRVYAYNSSEESAYSNEFGYQPTGTPIADRRFLVDFGAPTVPNTATGWNKITTYTVGTPISLVASDGSSSGVKVTVTAAANHNFGDGSPYNAQGYNGTVLDYPAAACVDNHFAYQTGGTYKVTGLFTDRYYSVRIYGSRAVAATDRKGTFTFNGKQLILDGSNNSSNTILFYYLKPNVAGELILDFGVAAGSQFGYLSVMDIKEKTTPTILEPLSLQATSNGSSVSLSWTDNSSNETGFKIERRMSGDALFTEIGSTSSGTTTYTDNTVSGTHTYEYRVFSYKSDENSAYSTTVSVAFQAATLNAPTNLKGYVSGLLVTLQWTDTNTGESGTKIERSTNGEEPFTLVGTVGANVTEYAEQPSFTGVSPSFFYRVYAYNGSMNSAKSNIKGIESVPVPSLEYNVLKDLYDSLDGDHWVNKTNWLPTGQWPSYVNGYPYGTWAGVTLNGPKLTGLNLSGKHLKGKIPSSISNMHDFQVLKFNNNKITGALALDFSGVTELNISNNLFSQFPAVPSSSGSMHSLRMANNKFTTLEPTINNFINLQDLDVSRNELQDLPALTHGTDTLNISNNYLDFADIEPLLSSTWSKVIYSPQKKIRDVGSLEVMAGETLTIPARNFGSHSSITWEKRQPNGTWSSVNSSNQDGTQHTFQRNSAVISETGLYRWRMTNSVATALTLESEEIEVVVHDAIGKVLADWAFQYEYDGRKRMTGKKLPGAGWAYMAYDLRDRLVFAQDAAQRKRFQWTYTKYDEYNRPVINGIYTDTTIFDLATIQAKIDTVHFSESFDDNESLGYTNTVMPSGVFHGSFEPLIVTYYDSYDFKTLIDGDDYDYDGSALEGQFPSTQNNSVVGLATAVKAKVLGTNDWIWTVSYYDDKDRVVQTAATNIRGGIDRLTNLYDFTGKVVSSFIRHESGAIVKTLKRGFDYDHSGRLLEITHKIDNDPAVVIQSNAYNELGQLITKQLKKPGGQVAQSIDFRYNIRGWLKTINNPADLTGPDLFSMALRYDDDEQRPQFNGNISQMSWRNSTRDLQNYSFLYDDMNRLWSANYLNSADPNELHDEYVGAPESNELGYDLNGNILNLIRSDEKDQIDGLQYIYSGNRLLRVHDYIDAVKGFVDVERNGDDYEYDASGNMRSDLNKDIKSITYNHLNLPEIVTKNSGEYIDYDYDATGRKLAQTVYDRYGSQAKKTQYAGDFLYENDTLQFVNHEEGRVILKGAPEYQYHLKDHLGNVRLTMTTKHEDETAKATMETPNEVTEYGQFIGYDELRRVNSTIFDHTYDGTTPPNGTAYSIRLTGYPYENLGPRRSLSVMPGDTIKTEVFVKYYTPPTDNTTNAFTTLMAQILAGNPPAGTFKDGGLFGTHYPDVMYQASVGFDEKNFDVGPKAYLNWLVFDREWNLIDEQSSYKRMSSAPLENGSNVSHERLAPNADIVITKPGYVYIWVSNESNTQVDVYFDDFKVEQIKSPVVSSQDYFPFGVTFNEYERENSVLNQYLYNGKENQDEMGLGWLDYGARMYMPEIGRWGVVDPIPESSARWSPYAYAYDNPLFFIDPTGMLNAGYQEKPKDPKYPFDIREKQDKGFDEEPIMPKWNKTQGLGGEAVCETCPKDKAYDDYRNADQAFGYDEQSGIVYNDVGDVGITDTFTGYRLIAKEYSLMEKWGRSEGLIGSTTYQMVDAFYVTGHFFTPWAKSRHLDGQEAIGDDKTEAFFGVVSTSAPYAKAPVIPRFSRNLNAAQFSQMFKGTFVNRLRPKFRGMINKFFNKQMDKSIRNSVKPTVAIGGFFIDEKD